jgi:hypothetical protein
MNDDPIVEEIRRAREAIFAEHNYDLRALGRALQDAEKQHGDRLVSLPPRHVEPRASAPAIIVSSSKGSPAASIEPNR